MDLVGCAVVGIGAIGRRHAKLLAGRRDARLLACCDRDPSAGDRTPEGVPLVADLDEALATPGLQAVLICTPADSHLAIVERARARGLAVFCEKPLTATLEDASRLRALAAAESPGAPPLVIGHLLRFDPDYAAARKAVAGGEIGELVQLWGRQMIPAYEGRQIANRTTLAVEVAVHEIDVLRWIAGDVVRVHAEGGRLAASPEGQVDAIAATLRFATGVVATLELNWTMPGTGPESVSWGMQAFGTAGAITVDRAGITPDHTDVLLAAEHDRLLDMVRGEGSWPVTLAEAEATLAAALALDESLNSGQPVSPSAPQRTGPS